MTNFFQCLLLIILLGLLDLSQSFTRQFKCIRPPRIHLHLNSENHGIDNEKIRNELFSEGLELWSKFFLSTRNLNFVKPATDFLVGENVMEMVNDLRRNSWKLLVYPILPDLIVDKVRKVPLKEFELEPVVDFFLNQRFYRQLACLIAIQSDPPITADHFQRPTLNALIRTMEYLFKVRPSRIDQLFHPMVYDKMFLVAPLVACTKHDPEIVQKTLLKAAQVSKVQTVVQVCAGIMLTNHEIMEYNQALYDRNEKLIEFLESELLSKDSKDSMEYAAFKALRVMNLIKLNSADEQRILLSIYLDESEESVAELFRLLAKIAALPKSDYYKKIIDSYKLK